MYKIYGIEPTQLDYPDNMEPFYPEFTPNKQLQIIQIICEECKTFNIHKLNKDAEWWFGAEEYWSEYKYEAKNKSFTNGLADILVQLENKLPKNKIKRILTSEI